MKSYLNILCIFILSLSMLSFTNIFCDSYYNHANAVLIPALTADYTCDIRIKNIPESDIALYSNIPDVDMMYTDGNLDFFLTDTNKFESVAHQIQKIFNTHNEHSHEITETTPNIYIYYGVDYNDLVEVDDDARKTISVFQVVLIIIAIITMVLVYSDYIDQRSKDIRTLSAIGISERQLHWLFWGECNILYLISVLIGLPLGGFLAYLFCKVCEIVDMTNSNAVYPVFDLNINSLLTTALLGYLAIYITFWIVLEKILKIDATYTCADTIIEFNPNASRKIYYKTDNHFYKFFASVLRKRSSSKLKILVGISAFIIAVSIFMLNAINYLAGEKLLSSGNNSLAAVAALVSNAGIFIMVAGYAIVYSLIIIHVFTKRQMESCSKAVRILYAIGADEETMLSCFRRYTWRKILSSELSGFILGYVFTILIFHLCKYEFYINILFLIGNIVLVTTYCFVYLRSMKKYFYKNCHNTNFEEEGRLYGTT